jgi:hypothetical protein
MCGARQDGVDYRALVLSALKIGVLISNVTYTIWDKHSGDAAETSSILYCTL